MKTRAQEIYDKYHKQVKASASKHLNWGTIRSNDGMFDSFSTICSVLARFETLHVEKTRPVKVYAREFLSAYGIFYPRAGPYSVDSGLTVKTQDSNPGRAGDFQDISSKDFSLLGGNPVGRFRVYDGLWPILREEFDPLLERLRNEAESLEAKALPEAMELIEKKKLASEKKIADRLLGKGSAAKRMKAETIESLKEFFNLHKKDSSCVTADEVMSILQMDKEKVEFMLAIVRWRTRTPSGSKLLTQDDVQRALDEVIIEAVQES